MTSTAHNNTMNNVYPSRMKESEERIARLQSEIENLRGEVEWEKEQFEQLSEVQRLACYLHEKICRRCNDKSCPCGWGPNDFNESVFNRTAKEYIEKATKLLEIVDGNFDKALNFIETVM